MKSYLLGSRKNQAAFTVLEMLFVVSLFAIIGHIAVLSLTEMSTIFEKAQVIETVERDLKQAQLLAIKDACRVVWDISSTASSSYGYGCDYQGYNTSIPVVPDQVELTRDLGSSFTVESTEQLIFDTNGGVINSGGVAITPTLTLKTTVPSASTIAVINLNSLGSFNVS